MDRVLLLLLSKAIDARQTFLPPLLAQPRNLLVPTNSSNRLTQAHQLLPPIVPDICSTTSPNDLSLKCLLTGYSDTISYCDYTATENGHNDGEDNEYCYYDTNFQLHDVTLHLDIFLLFVARCIKVPTTIPVCRWH
jgi:hypothetical protein